MQSVGQASTQSSSLVQVSVMMYAMITISDLEFLLPPSPRDSGDFFLRHLQCTKMSTIEAVTPVTDRL